MARLSRGVNELLFFITKKTLFVMALLITLISIPTLGQGNLARILGTITDQSGGVISGATVTIVDIERGASRTLITDEAGEYLAPDLVPGAYSVRAEATGFKRIERAGLTLEVGKDIRIDLILQPGDRSQTITVTEEGPMVEATNATLGGTLNNQTINDLPLNGRNYINLLTLRPGVTVYPGGGSDSRSANGTRTEDIGYLIDGLRGDEAYTGESVLNAPIPAGDSASSLPIDAIQEFNTEENPKAEFGWKPGAIVNAGVKSGTNKVHGTALAFGRTTGLDARNFFDPAPTPKNPIGLEQFGGSVGGAIKKDKLFYFLNYEGQRYSVGSSYTTTPPVTVALPGGGNGCKSMTTGDCQHSLIDACNDILLTAGGVVTPLSAHIAGLNPSTCSRMPTNFTPGANESLFPENTNPNGLILGLTSTNQQDNGVAKVDYHINAKHTVSGMYFNGRGGGIWNDRSDQPGLPWQSDLRGRTQLAEGSWTWNPTSAFVNELRAGYSRFAQTALSVDANVNPLKYGINTGVTDSRLFGFPLIMINPFSQNSFRLGGNWPKITGPDGSLQFLDHVSILRGRHALKFGGEFIHNDAAPFITTSGKGKIRFRSLEDFLQGNVRNNAPLSSILIGDLGRHLHNEQFAAFGQDDWRVTPRLTVNLGLRYELTTVPVDSKDQLGNFLPASGLVQAGQRGVSILNTDYRNFSPRVGLAWDVSGNGKTVIRAGGNIMYEQLPLNAFIAVANLLGLNQVPTGADIVVNGVTTPGSGNIKVLSLNVPGTILSPNWQAQTSACVTSGTAACGSIFPSTIQCGDGVGADPSPCSTEAVDPNLRTPYITTWTLNLQRAITNKLLLEVAYVGNHGSKLLGFTDINQPSAGAAYSAGELAYCNSNVAPLTPNPTFSCDPQNDASPAQAQANRPYTLNGKYPYLGQIDRLSNLDISNYHALQVTLTQRSYHGLSFIVGYTYSHSLDEASSTYNANWLPVTSAAPRLMYGNSDFDRTHVLTVSGSYAIPGKKSFAQLLEGWQINYIATLMTGAPWSPADLSNDFPGTDQIDEINSFGQYWNFTGNHNDFKSSNIPIPCWGGIGPSALSGCTITGTTPPALCLAAAKTNDELNTLYNIGCYVKGKSVLTPPQLGKVGNSTRNIFRDSGFRNLDISVIKTTKFNERLTAQFRAEFFNILNHPEFSNPFGPSGFGLNDPSAGGTFFGCGCITPDQAAPNPVLGSGGARSIQLGLKLIF